MGVAWVPVSTASRMLRITRQRVYQLLSNGQLAGRRVDRVWLISYSSIVARLDMLEREEVKLNATR